MLNHLYNKYHALPRKYEFSARFADAIIDNLMIDHSPGVCGIRVTQFYFIVTYLCNEDLIFTIEGLHDEVGRDLESLTIIKGYLFFPQRDKLIGNLEIKISANTSLKLDVPLEPKYVSMANPRYIEVLDQYIKHTKLYINSQK